MRGLFIKSSAMILAILVNSSYAAPVTDNSTSSSEETTEVIEQEEAPLTALELSLESFLAQIPSEKIQNMTATMYLESAVAREASNFLRSREFLDAKDKLLEASEVQEFVKFLNQSGLNLVRLVRKVGCRTGIPVTIRSEDGEEIDSSEDSSEEEQVVVSSEAATMLAQLVDKVLAELPQEQFFAVFFEKMESDSEFSDFVERLNGDEFEAILLKVQVRWTIKGKALVGLKSHQFAYFVRRTQRPWTSSKRRCWITI